MVKFLIVQIRGGKGAAIAHCVAELDYLKMFIAIILLKIKVDLKRLKKKIRPDHTGQDWESAGIPVAACQGPASAPPAAARGSLPRETPSGLTS